MVRGTGRSMARAEKKLSAVSLKRLEPGLHGDGLGLWFQHTPAGNKSWIFRYYRHGKARAMGLGPLHSCSLAEAREKAAAARRLLLADLDPIAERDRSRAESRLEAAKAITVRVAGERYIAAHRAGWRNEKHALQWSATLTRYVHPHVGDLPVASIDTGHVMRILEEIWASKVETASRVRARLESILDWCTARGFRTGPNPARWKGHLSALLPPKSRVRRVKHFPAMDYRELPAFMGELKKRQSVSALALRFCILQAARTGEVIGAEWHEIDLKTALWTVPAERMKAGRLHRAPLSKASIALLKKVPRVRGVPYVFPGSRVGRPLSNMSMLELLRGMRPGLSVHGFRSSFKSWCAAETSFAREVAEAALAHQIADSVERAYLRDDLLTKRRELMEAWSKFAQG